MVIKVGEQKQIQKPLPEKKLKQEVEKEYAVIKPVVGKRKIKEDKGKLIKKA